jgi:hypothetical protein
MLTPPAVSIVMLPGVLFAAVAVATGLFNTLLMVRSSASAGVAIVASNRQANGLRLTISLKAHELLFFFESGSPNGRESAMAASGRQAH